VDPALDRSKIRELLDLTGGEVEWLKDLMDTYLQDTRTRLDELAGLVAAGSGDRIQRSAHGIKGSSSNIGATRMADLCAGMEHHAKLGDKPATVTQLALLEAEFARIRADLPAALSPNR
jgi:HPt (histidine-containing phosphotransfer) domain-containing protein